MGHMNAIVRFTFAEHGIPINLKDVRTNPEPITFCRFLCLVYIYIYIYTHTHTHTRGAQLETSVNFHRFDLACVFKCKVQVSVNVAACSYNSCDLAAVPCGAESSRHLDVATGTIQLSRAVSIVIAWCRAVEQQAAECAESTIE